MGLFGTSSELVKLWQKTKKDGEKARGGGKPGGKMGFEALITTLDKALKASDPNLVSIKAQITSLSTKMIAYAGSLDPAAERVFIVGIRKYNKFLGELLVMVDDTSQNAAAEDRRVTSAKLKLGRVMKLSDSLLERMDDIKKAIDAIDFTGAHGAGADAITRIKEAAKELDTLDKEIQALGRERDAQVPIIMAAVDG